MPRLLIIDADSMLGRHCCADFERAGWSVLGTAAQPKPGSGLVPCTVTSAADIDSVVSILSPDTIVNCTQVDPMAQPDIAYGTHVGGSLNVLAAAAKHRPGIPVLLVGCGSMFPKQTYRGQSPGGFGGGGAPPRPVDPDGPTLVEELTEKYSKYFKPEPNAEQARQKYEAAD